MKHSYECYCWFLFSIYDLDFMTTFSLWSWWINTIIPGFNAIYFVLASFVLRFHVQYESLDIILCVHLIIICLCNALEIHTILFWIPIVLTTTHDPLHNFMKPCGISDLNTERFFSLLSRDGYSLDQNCQSQKPGRSTCGSLKEWRATARPTSLGSCHSYKCYQKGQLFQLLIPYFTFSFKWATSSCHIQTIRPRGQQPTWSNISTAARQSWRFQASLYSE